MRGASGHDAWLFTCARDCPCGNSIHKAVPTLLCRRPWPLRPACHTRACAIGCTPQAHPPARLPDSLPLSAVDGGRAGQPQHRRGLQHPGVGFWIRRRVGGLMGGTWAAPFTRGGCHAQLCSGGTFSLASGMACSMCRQWSCFIWQSFSTVCCERYSGESSAEVGMRNERQASGAAAERRRPTSCACSPSKGYRNAAAHFSRALILLASVGNMLDPLRGESKWQRTPGCGRALDDPLTLVNVSASAGAAPHPLQVRPSAPLAINNKLEALAHDSEGEGLSPLGSDIEDGPRR